MNESHVWPPRTINHKKTYEIEKVVDEQAFLSKQLETLNGLRHVSLHPPLVDQTVNKPTGVSVEEAKTVKAPAVSQNEVLAKFFSSLLKKKNDEGKTETPVWLTCYTFVWVFIFNHC